MAAVWDTQAAGSMGRIGSPGTEGNKYSKLIQNRWASFHGKIFFTELLLKTRWTMNFSNHIVKKIHYNGCTKFSYIKKKNCNGSLQHFRFFLSRTIFYVQIFFLAIKKWQSKIFPSNVALKSIKLSVNLLKSQWNLRANHWMTQKHHMISEDVYIYLK